MSFVKTLLGKSDKNGLKLIKQSSGDWVVKKGSAVLYIGSKDKCETYMSYTG